MQNYNFYWVWNCKCKSFPGIEFPLNENIKYMTGAAFFGIFTLACLSLFTVGLVENLIEYIKQTHAKINMEALQVGKPNTKKKEDPLVAELVMTFDLLRNFLHQNLEAKVKYIHT